jgi:hypothetical protein
MLPETYSNTIVSCASSLGPPGPRNATVILCGSWRNTEYEHRPAKEKILRLPLVPKTRKEFMVLRGKNAQMVNQRKPKLCFKEFFVFHGANQEEGIAKLLLVRAERSNAQRPPEPAHLFNNGWSPGSIVVICSQIRVRNQNRRFAPDSPEPSGGGGRSTRTRCSSVGITSF